MKKQLKLIIATIVMVLASLTGYGQNNLNDQFDFDGYAYKITSLTPPQVEVVGYTAAATEVTILQKVNHNGTDYDVTGIGNEAFQNKQLTQVIFINTPSNPSNVTRIGVRAFRQNNLTDIEIPESVNSMGEGAFDKNDLTSVNIPKNITIIEQWTFAANDLRELTIPANVDHIEFQAFFGNQNLAKVTVERNPATTLHEKAFESSGFNTRGGVDLVVPFGQIQAYEDAGWKGLEFGTITSGITTIDGIKYGITTSPTEATLVGHAGVSVNLNIPSTVDIGGNSYPVTAIGDGAFLDPIIVLLTVIIPESVKSIGFQAFYNPRLTRVTMQGNDPPTLDPDAFEYPHRTEIDLIVPEGREKAYRDAGWTGFREIFSLIGRLHRDMPFDWVVTSLIPNKMELHAYHSLVDILEIPSEIEYLSNSLNDNIYTVTAIGDQAFKGRQLTSVLIPNTVDRIGVGAFQDNQLTSVEIPTSVTYIGENAFVNNKLTSIQIPESVTEIGGTAFRYNQLTSITTPVNVRRIRRWTYGSNQLTEVTISDSVKFIELYAFRNNPDLRLVTVEPIDPPVLHEHAFSNADRHQIDLVVPMSDTSIQVYLDHGWDGFRSISFGIFTVDDIRYAITSSTEVMVVDYMGTATAVTIPETVVHGTNTYTVTTIGESAFQNKQLANVEIPTSVTSIRQKAFMDNQLTSVTIPGSVESIGFHAFYNNPDLGLVTVRANNPPALHATAFANANRHQIELVVPKGKRQDYLDNGWDGFRSISFGVFTVDAPQSVDNLEPFTVNIRFGGEVTDFEADDIQVTNATVSILTGSGSRYTATIVPTSLCNGNITIDVMANVATVEVSGNCENALSIPTAFTPNGDGANDHWIIDHLSENASVRIYDRHGTIIFSSDNGYTRPWDGTSRGSRLPAGSYLYLIQNGPHTYRGSVTILL